MAGIKFDILGNNNPALKALAELRESLAKVNASFKETKKNAGSGSGGAFDPKEINSIGEQLKGVNGIIKNMSMSSNQWNRGSGAKELKTGFDGVTQAAKGLYGVVSGLFPVMAGLTGYGVVRGLANLASGFGSAATNVQKVNYQTGLPSRTIQKYENRFMEYGIDKKDTDEGLNNFFQKMRGAAYGMDPQTLQFLQGPQMQIKDIIKRFKDPKQQEGLLNEVMEKVQKVGATSPEAREAVTSQLGQNWLTPAMMYSPEKTEELNKRAEKAGFIANDEQLKQGINFKTDLNHLGLLGDAFGKQIGLGVAGISEHVLSPAITPRNAEESWKYWVGSDKKDKDNLSSTDDNNPQKALANGIPLNVPNPNRDSTVTIEFPNAPPGTKITTSPNSNVKVKQGINYSGFDNQ